MFGALRSNTVLCGPILKDQNRKKNITQQSQAPATSPTRWLLTNNSLLTYHPLGHIGEFDALQCHMTGEIFIWLFLLSVSAAREGWEGSTEAKQDSVQPNTLCLKVKYYID